MIAHITIIFSLSMSVKKWQKMGIFEKEMLLFSKYIERGVTKQVSLFTYDSSDVELINQAISQGKVNPAIKVIKAPAFAANKFGAIVYSLIGPIIQRRHFRSSATVITHQGSGAWAGLVCKLLFSNRFVYRYGHSLWRRHLDRRQYHRLLFSWPVDKILNASADYSLICTKQDFIAAGQRQNSALCPNFIDTTEIPLIDDKSDFQRQWNGRKERAIYVGRLVSFKNLFNLIEACANSDLPLDIYGGGPLENELKQFAKNLGSDCVFKGVTDNNTIRKELTNYKYYFLVSTYEGMPKSLLEGMVSGCLCIVSPHYGCTEVIEHKNNGIVSADYSMPAITDAISFAKNNDCFELIQRARLDVEELYSLNKVIDLHRVALNQNPEKMDRFAK